MFGWVGYVLTITGLLLAGKKSIYCWPVWIASNMFWVIGGVTNSTLDVVTCNLTLLVFNMIGWRGWLKKSTSSDKTPCV